MRWCSSRCCWSAATATCASANPWLRGGRVKAFVVNHGRGKKVRVIKFKRRKGFMRRQGHRQGFTEVKVTGIEAA